jgi:translation initiation factor IF-3
VRFLGQRAKVKVTIMFRGRETLHPERGRDLLMRLAEDVKELGLIEQQPILDGRNMVMVLAPTKNVGAKSDAEDEDVKGSKEAVQGDRVGKDPAPPASPDDTAGAPDQEPSGEAEARAAARAGSA